MNEFNEAYTKEYRKSNHPRNQQHDPEGSFNQFRLSNCPPYFGQSLTILQVENANRIAQLQVDIKLSLIFEIFQIKVLNKLHQGFSKIKKAEDPLQSVYSCHKNINGIIEQFTKKVDRVCERKKIKYMSNLMTTLKILTNHSRNQNSKRQMLRVNSRMDHQYDDFQLLQRNNSYEGVPSEKTNKMLMKKKEKNDKQLSLFKLQMEQLLSQHQSYLKKKN